ncbi:MAG TPA: DUF3040 domain-containing protein [Trebonia sp.]|jgi:hypothetical protein|nr:DUF3040 domain-containing protein [Trebonia sp.]
MALSMDEQRMLAEIERRLAAEEPGLAARLSSFKRPGPAAGLRSPRGRVVGSLSALALAVVLSVMVYAMIPFRAHGPKGIVSPQATGNVPASSPAKVAPKTGATGTTGPASSAAAGTAQQATAGKQGSASAGKTGASSKPATAQPATDTTKTTSTTADRAP